MKRTAILFLALLAFAGCKDDREMDVMDTFSQSFDAIRVDTYGDVVFMQADSQTIHISGPYKMVKKIDFKVRDGELVVNSASNIGVRGTKKVSIVITAPDIARFDFRGAGIFTCNGLTLNHDLYMLTQGAGDINIADLQCENFNLKFQGVGEFQGVNLQCENIDVNVSGVGSANLNVQCRNTLAVNLSGVGSVSVTGTTKYLDLQHDGVGSVNVKQLTVSGE